MSLLCITEMINKNSYIYLQIAKAMIRLHHQNKKQATQQTAKALQTPIVVNLILGFDKNIT